MAQGNQVMAQAVQTMYELTADEAIRQQCLAREKQIREHNTVMRMKERAFRERDEAFAKLNAAVAERDAAVEMASQQIAQRDQQIAELLREIQQLMGDRPLGVPVQGHDMGGVESDGTGESGDGAGGTDHV